MAEDWSKEEVALIVHDYFDMLSLELANRPYNKTAFRQRILPLLKNRSSGSVEFKHQNISAVLLTMGLPFIKGYKPRSNYQQMLEEEVAVYLKRNRSAVEPGFEQFASTQATMAKKVVDYASLLADAPALSGFQESEPTYRPIKINYLEREQNNRKLGEEGEALVIAYEHSRLQKAGKEALADKIEWVSKERGDGTGFDILSRNENGTDRYIEVKTTKLTKETPIYLTRTEVNFATHKQNNFYLYRLYNFDAAPGMFIKQGAYNGYCRLVAESYKGYF